MPRSSFLSKSVSAVLPISLLRAFSTLLGFSWQSSLSLGMGAKADYSNFESELELDSESLLSFLY